MHGRKSCVLFENWLECVRVYLSGHIIFKAITWECFIGMLAIYGYLCKIFSTRYRISSSFFFSFFCFCFVHVKRSTHFDEVDGHVFEFMKNPSCEPMTVTTLFNWRLTWRKSNTLIFNVPTTKASPQRSICDEHWTLTLHFDFNDRNFKWFLELFWADFYDCIFGFCFGCWSMQMQKDPSINKNHKRNSRKKKNKKNQK